MLLSAADYHDLTSYDRDKMIGHQLDWSNQPNSFKNYEGLKKIRLEENTEQYTGSLSELFGPRKSLISKGICFQDLSLVLKLSHCLTRKERSSNGYFYFRNVASAGALYPFEIYLATFNTLDLDQGLYHHSVADQSIVQLREGNFCGAVSSAIDFRRTDQLAAVFFLTAIFFRSSWKYRERAYRYHLLDTGHLCENLFLALKSENLNFEISYDFDDSIINEFLAIDVLREVCMVTVGVFSENAPDNSCLDSFWSNSVNLKKFSSCAKEERRYPVINSMHAFTSTRKPVHENDSTGHQNLFFEKVGVPIKLETFQNSPELINYSQALFQRRSRRNFAQRPIPLCVFSWVMSFLKKEKPLINSNFLSIGLLISNVEGIAPGFYMTEPDGSMRLMFSLFVPERIAHICLDQAWLSNCSCNFLFLADLLALEEEFGPRSYRYAMVEAGRQGQRLYLAAEAVKFGCCGIGAFYDREARQFLNLRSDVRLLYLVGFGPLTKTFA
ncbi:MAG: SagB/ThcOx family dehydrogenase [Desulfomonilaceae bacterium]